jgi:hypothetical protein
MSRVTQYQEILTYLDVMALRLGEFDLFFAVTNLLTSAAKKKGETRSICLMASDWTFAHGLKIAVFWNMTPCSMVGYNSLEGESYPHFLYSKDGDSTVLYW